MSIIDFKMVKVFKFDQQFYPVNSLFKSWPFLWAFPHFWVSIHILLVTKKIFLILKMKLKIQSISVLIPWVIENFIEGRANSLLCDGVPEMFCELKEWSLDTDPQAENLSSSFLLVLPTNHGYLMEMAGTLSNAFKLLSLITSQSRHKPIF